MDASGHTGVAAAANNSKAAISWLFGSMFDMANSFDTTGLATALTGMGMDPWPGYMDSPMLIGMGQNPYYFSGPAVGDNWVPLTMYKMQTTSNGYANEISQSLLTTATPNNGDPRTTPKIVGQLKSSRTVSWSTLNWRNSVAPVDNYCADDGVSFPHRTLGWKMLKDDLFGIDIGGTNPTTGAYTSAATDKVVGAGEVRTGAYGNNGKPAHDIDSVCLDCHNPTVWNATSSLNHTDTVGVDPTTGVAVDTAANGNSIYNDDVIQRGLP